MVKSVYGVNPKIWDKAMYIIQNKLNMTMTDWMEMKMKELIKEYDKEKKKK